MLVAVHVVISTGGIKVNTPPTRIGTSFLRAAVFSRGSNLETTQYVRLYPQFYCHGLLDVQAWCHRNGYAVCGAQGINQVQGHVLCRRSRLRLITAIEDVARTVVGICIGACFRDDIHRMLILQEPVLQAVLVEKHFQRMVVVIIGSYPRLITQYEILAKGFEAILGLCIVVTVACEIGVLASGIVGIDSNPVTTGCVQTVDVPGSLCLIVPC